MATQPKIFISYRRKDSAFATTAIYAPLAAAFGNDNIFLDVDSIRHGRDFRAQLKRAISRCNVFLAVIGDNWHGSSADGELSRIQSPKDYVRAELEAALARDIPVIPLLIGDATLPTAKSLPPKIKQLRFRQAMSIRPLPDFHHDIRNVIQSICRTLGLRPAGEEAGEDLVAPSELPGFHIDEHIRAFDLSGWRPDRESTVNLRDYMRFTGVTGQETVSCSYGSSGTVVAQCTTHNVGKGRRSTEWGWKSGVTFDVALRKRRSAPADALAVENVVEYRGGFQRPNGEYFVHRPVLLRRDDHEDLIAASRVTLILGFPERVRCSEVVGMEAPAGQPSRNRLAAQQPHRFGNTVVWSIVRPKSDLHYTIKWKSEYLS